MNNIEVVGLGALNIDYLYQVERILEDGETVVSEAKSSPGGSAANTIYGLAKLGMKTGFIGVVGDDAEGKILLQDFQKVGVDTSQIRVKPGSKTGSVLCLSDRQGKRSLYVLPGANNLLTMDDLDLTYINQAGMLHLSSFADDRQFKISLELMNRLELSTKLSSTPGAIYAQKELKTLAPILNKTHILFVNQDEIRQMTGEDITAGAQTCLEQGCYIVVVTLGKGVNLEPDEKVNQKLAVAICFIKGTEYTYIIEPLRQETVSEPETTGAGDAFATGFLYGLLNGKGLTECGVLGDIVAQFSIAEIGARKGLPTRNALLQRYRELYNKEL